MRTLERRIDALESALPGECVCERGPGMGLRVIYDHDWDIARRADPEPRCRHCGKPRPVLVIRYVNDWRQVYEEHIEAT